jgi:hypothetical protein
MWGPNMLKQCHKLTTHDFLGMVNLHTTYKKCDDWGMVYCFTLIMMDLFLLQKINKKKRRVSPT